MTSAIVIGSGAGGSVAALELVRAGFDVLVLEKGRNLLPGLGGSRRVGSSFGNDEVKAGRYFENQDIVLEPRTSRTQAEAQQGVARSFIGDVNTLPTTVGGGTVHWDAKTPRLWKQDFAGRTLYGPVPGANVADWPLSYDDLAPFYDEIERRLGVQGDVGAMPAATLAQAPRRHQFVMPPNPPMYAGSLLAEGAAAVGYHAYPFPMAINSTEFEGRPRCNSCGFCSGFGCPINARGGAALSFLHPAIRAGAELRTRTFVSRIDLNATGTAARGVSYLDDHGRTHRERADIVIVAASAVETARLLLLSATGHAAHRAGLGNRSGQLGANLMFHFFTLAIASFATNVHAWRGPASTFTLDDLVGPHRGPEARAAGMPYLKGGVCEVGLGVLLLEEAQLYATLQGLVGAPHKDAMRGSAFREHLTRLHMVGEDMPQLGNRVDLDPEIRDVYGFPVPRITHSQHPFELASSDFLGPKLGAICDASPGVVGSQVVPTTVLGGSVGTAHVMGTARMGRDPSSSVADPWGRVHDLDNVYLADGSVFVSSGGFNPTLTIMALSLRMARHLAGRGDGMGDGAPS
jgi:choline dehydrogenase-like flavoprotein